MTHYGYCDRCGVGTKTSATSSSVVPCGWMLVFRTDNKLAELVCPACIGKSKN